MNPQKSVFILGDAYFNVSQEQLFQTIIDLYSQGFHVFYVTNGCDFDRLAMEILNRIFLNFGFECTKLKIVLSPRSDLASCLNECEKVLTAIEPSQLIDDEVGLDDHPILYAYNNREVLGIEIVNLF